MINMTLSHIAQVLGGEMVGDDCEITLVSTDTRNLQAGALFVALIGERFDAHDFAQQALESGATALLVSRPLEIAIPQLVVSDTKQALGLLGAYVHQKCATPTVAITGSCGKTTVKEMVASIMAQQGQVLFTAGNFNNDIGVPLTLLRSTPQDDFAVIELGANHIGEIAYTSALVTPDVALVNNVAAAHLEGFGSIDGVKQAKGEIYQGLKAGGVAIVNLESHGGQFWQPALADKQVKTFSVSDPSADYYADHIAINANGEASFTLHSPLGSAAIQLGIIGQHNVSNALAAASLAVELGADLATITAGLALLSKVKGRVELVALSNEIRLIDDSYNASVPAMKAAADLLAGFSGTRWLILGNMAELGDESLALHRQVGEHAAPFNFEHVLTFGADAKAISDVCQGQHFESHDSMIEFIKQQLPHHTGPHTLLVKGANSAGMSKVATALKEIYS
ncbi:UDP-N-acetylmuramoyl-tripeptide--D-alanyl-D-alanine ligase [Vibrio scophthalmi]|uniref:UDP-N-acetylmuramoyl-tripeptide--D-alanyl-D-alanine ligase n=1 Tax=Vibrio scophthalmi LMG 19158 TaxID=870967 RepID=F9RLA8_9VIBR|nr:UDP-N-acetylmuramoyl-tripeptide--D-alanyl-D-alanine ligase [Vibrio scophthalmi]EGU38912.1 UDP-N-acetylmuramoyl-tripeptide--D-alanyl-D-alanine ligase [Vibrio scophthalmi LMG 19158]